MKIHLVSDLHLEFGDCKLPGGEVLIIAGDLAEIDSINHKRYGPIIQRFAREELSKYNHVFYVFGNHEHYHGNMGRSHDIAREYFSRNAPNVIILENEFKILNDVKFVGCTLWANFEDEHPVSISVCGSTMNDHRIIYIDGSIVFLPRHAIEINKQSREFIRLATIDSMPTVVITHHAPSFESVPSFFKGDMVNGAYANHMEDFMKYAPHIKYWVHGHIHDPVSYTVADTRVESNPRGYHNYERDTVDYTPKILEI